MWSNNLLPGVYVIRKKILSLILTAVLVASIVGCGKSEEPVVVDTSENISENISEDIVEYER